MDTELPKSDVGILFVHGIGSQSKGTQLVPFAGALRRTLLSREIVPKGKQPITVDVQAVTLVGSDPAHARMTVGRSGSQTADSEWLIAESLWSESFIPPTVRETLLWLAYTAPLVLTTRALEGIQAAFRGLRRDFLSFWKLIVYVIWVPLALPIGVVAIVTIAILALIRGFIPFAWAKNLIASLELLVTHAIGDSYLYATDPVNSIAMETAVGRDIDWLKERSHKLIIVAHSQGASVAVGALARRDKVSAFVTLGAGIGQLAWLKRFMDNRTSGAIALASWVFGLALVAFVIGAIVLAIGGNLQPINLILGFGGLVFVPQLINLAGEHPVRFTRRGMAPVNKLPSPAPASKWEDIFATSDPVPGGAAAAREFDGVTSVPVWNKGDLVRDHGGYLSNRAEVVARVVRLALLDSPRATQLGVAKELAATLPLTSGLRYRRGKWIERLRVVVIVGLIALVARQWAEVVTIGEYWVAKVGGLGFDIPTEIPVVLIPTVNVVSVVVVAIPFLLAYALGAGIAGIWGGAESPASIRAQLKIADNGFGSRGAYLAFLAYFWLLVIAVILVSSIQISHFKPLGDVVGIGLGALAASAIPQFFLSLPFSQWQHGKSKVVWIRNSTEQSRRRAFWRIVPFTTVLFAGLLLAWNFMQLPYQLAWSALGFVVVFYVAMALSLKFSRPVVARPQAQSRRLMYFPNRATIDTPNWVLAVFAEALIIGLQVLAYFLFFYQFSLEAQGYAFLPIVILGFVGTLGFIFWLDDLSGPLDPSIYRVALLNWALVAVSLTVSGFFFVRLFQSYPG